MQVTSLFVVDIRLCEFFVHMQISMRDDGNWRILIVFLNELSSERESGF